MGNLEQFCVISENSCTAMYTQIFFVTKNHSNLLPKTNFSKMRFS